MFSIRAQLEARRIKYGITTCVYHDAISGYDYDVAKLYFVVHGTIFKIKYYSRGRVPSARHYKLFMKVNSLIVEMNDEEIEISGFHRIGRFINIHSLIAFMEKYIFDDMENAEERINTLIIDSVT